MPKVVNLISVDVEMLELTYLLIFLIVSPITAVVGCVLLLIYIGVSGLLGMVVIFLMVYLQMKVSL